MGMDQRPDPLGVVLLGMWHSKWVKRDNVSKKRKKLAIGLTLLAMALLCLVGILVFHLGDYWQVQAELARLEGAQVVGLRAEPEIRLEQFHATLRLENGCEVAASFRTSDSLRPINEIKIGELQGWRVAIRGCDCTYQQVDVKTGEKQCSKYLGTGFEIVKNGDLGGLVPFPVSSVQDLVDQYDDLISVLESMPMYPQYGHLVAENGNELYYQRYPSDLDLSDLPNSVWRNNTLEFTSPGCNPY